MRGDSKSYRELIPYADDFLLMSPFGGTPSRASEYTPERIEAIGRSGHAPEAFCQLTGSGVSATGCRIPSRRLIRHLELGSRGFSTRRLHR